VTEPRGLPDAARCVVIGGGVGGASIAHHLARLGWRDVVVLEQHELTEGTTWHSAGFVGQLRSTISQTRMIMYSSELYTELEALTGRDPGWRKVGGLRLATTPERVEELRRQESSAATYGLELDLLSPDETQEMLPLLAVDDVLASAWLPGDGYLDPEKLAGALADAAQRGGVAFHTHTKVTGIETADGRVVAVVTDRGRIATDVVVDAAGAAAGVVAALAGVSIPIVPMRHQYVVTEPLDPAVGEVPSVGTRITSCTSGPEAGGLLVGGYAREPRHLGHAGAAGGGSHDLRARSGAVRGEWAGALARVPALEGLELAKVVNGPEAFTPDGEFILGETEVAGFWVAAGFCVHGLAGAGGVGKLMAEWIVDGQPEWDVSSMDVRRFGRQYASARYARVRALDAYSRYYDVVYPHEEHEAGRPLRLSPTYARLRELGASFGEKSGWERANWFESNAARGDEGLRPRGWRGSSGRRRSRRSAWPPATLPGSSTSRLREARGPRPGGGRCPRPAVRQRCGRAGRASGVHAALEPARGHRSRPHGHPPGRGRLPGRHRHGVRRP
jgi:4-methylaminobutanoate oxidase (formaldehyde-forming)